ncbi:D-sedoheptulose-7-phosphate isomerase [Chryseolinea lacunae]|uniref:Phosphoheptose isomerase n=1 Tax=Chryseolinea lacunae TaxID=2801331 RepID=A0ABS1KUD7_9BACT|nr:D-sedoheptulose 7-phosphate isomerase [Chryseolinea lacunae]MBL0743051.1 D-sedoheptulose 7-phosphate isomerase [Chryseolinea lacunae]
MDTYDVTLHDSAIDSEADTKIEEIIQSHTNVIESLLLFNMHGIKELCRATLKCFNSGGKICFMGNGGSAADSQHLAAEFVGRFKTNRKPLPAMALTTDTSIITAVANDFGYEYIFERQVSSLCNPGDVLVAISTSGNSPCLVKAIEAAKTRGVFTIGLLGKDGGVAGNLVDLPIIVAANDTARIQEAHILIGHLLCEFCDEHYTLHY